MTDVFRLSSDLVDALAEASPIRATFMGVPGHDDRWDDLSPEGDAARAALFARFSAAADALPAAQTDDERLATLVLRDFLALEQDALAHHDPAVDLNILASPPQLLTMALDSMDQSTASGAAAAERRRATAAEALQGYQRTLLAGLARGQRVARRQVETVVGQAEAVAAEGGALGAAYADFGAWLRDHYLPHASEQDGFGEARYRRAARRFLGCDLDLHETYAWGWRRVAELRELQRRAAEDVAPGVGVDGVLDLLQRDARFCAPDADAFLAEMRRLQDVALAALDGSAGGVAEFDVPEALRRLDVRRAPAGGPPGAYYMPPSEDLGRPGAIIYGGPLEGPVPLFDQVSTAFHEGFPGHHLQCGLQVAMRERLSRLHRVAYGYSGFAEGWALYAEQRMDELGLYETAAARFGMWSNQMARACRVVVDIGMHLGLDIPNDAPFEPGAAWSFERAVALMRSYAGMSEARATSEVTRYLGWPGQAISYAVGHRAIVELRQRWRDARLARGEAEDLRTFHSRVLATGNVALDALPGLVLP